MRSRSAREKRSPLRRVTKASPSPAAPAGAGAGRPRRRPPRETLLPPPPPGLQDQGVFPPGDRSAPPAHRAPAQEGPPPLPLEAPRQRDRRQRFVDGVERPG